MTDLNEARGALSGQGPSWAKCDDEIERLEAELRMQREEAVKLLNAAEDKAARLAKALKPFASFADEFNDYAHDDNWSIASRNCNSLSLADFRRARASLSQQGEEI